MKKYKTFKHLIGIDEVGRGPVAGPVAVCAAMVRFDNVRLKSKSVNKFKDLPKLRDSKRLTEKGREVWYEVLKDNITFQLSYASAKEIDKKGIAVCIRSLIQKNLKKLNVKPEEVLILLDGSLKVPAEYIHQETIIGGDDKEPIISFASIYAKVERDRLMIRMARKYPQYGFERHKGYGTQLHMQAIKKHGISEVHRKTYLGSDPQVLAPKDK